MSKTNKNQTITLSPEKVKEILEILEKTNAKLGTVQGCCRNIATEETDGIEVIAFEIVDALCDARDILLEAKGQEVAP